MDSRNGEHVDDAAVCNKKNQKNIGTEAAKAAKSIKRKRIRYFLWEGEGQTQETHSCHVVQSQFLVFLFHCPLFYVLYLFKKTKRKEKKILSNCFLASSWFFLETRFHHHPHLFPFVVLQCRALVITILYVQCGWVVTSVRLGRGGRILIDFYCFLSSTLSCFYVLKVLYK